MKVNYVKGCTSKDVLSMSSEDLFKCLRDSEKLKKETEHYRDVRLSDVKSGSGRDNASSIKQDLPAFFPAAVMEGGRSSKNVKQLTGWVMCDFDHIPDCNLEKARTLVNADPHTLLSYVTVSGQGLRVIATYEVGKSKHKQKCYARAFEVANEYYSQLIGEKYDAVCKDLTRLSFCAHDPLAFFNPDCTPFSADDLMTEEQREEKRQAEVRGEQRRTEKEEKSAYNKAALRIDKVFDRRISKELESKDIRFVDGAHNNYVMRVGYRLNELGFEKKHAVEWARRKFGNEYPEAASVVESCYARTEDHGTRSDELSHILNSNEGIRQQQASLAELMELIRSKMEVRYNVLLDLPEVRWKKAQGALSRFDMFNNNFRPVNERDVSSLVVDCERSLHLRTTANDVHTLLRSYDTQLYDPIQEYLDSLPEWHEGDPDYLAEMAATVRVLDAEPDAQEFFTLMLKHFMVAMVKSWMSPDVVNEMMLVFIGAQGVGKSRWMRRLIPPQLEAYRRIKCNSSVFNKDDVISLSNCVACLLEELDAMDNPSMNQLKAILSSTTSNERAAYRADAKVRYNISSFLGTGNRQRFINDDTGARRFVPFTVEIVQAPDVHPFNYEGIYAQTYALMKAGFHHYLDEEMQARLNAHNQKYMTVDFEQELVSQLFRHPGPEESGHWMSASIIAQRLYEYFRFFRVDVNRIGFIMTQLGFEEQCHDGQLGYVAVERTFEEMRNVQRRLAIVGDER
jgi:hypothetical protein